MNWLKKYWKDSGFRMMTWFVLGLGLLSIPLMTWLDYVKASAYSNYNGIVLDGFYLFWGIYFVLIIPLAYLMRNNP